MVNKLFKSSFLVFVLIFCSPCLAREIYVALATRLANQAKTAELERPDLEQQLFTLANSYRKSKGLSALAKNNTAQDASLAHAMDMMLNNFMGHTASTGQDFDSRMRALRNGAMILPSMGENAARLSHADLTDPTAAKKIFQQWVNSPPHRHALLSRDYLSVATGVVAQGNKIYADQIFLGPEIVTNMGRVVPEVNGSLY